MHPPPSPGFGADAAREAERVLREALARSATDLPFRRRLLEDPRAAIEELTGRALPEEFHVLFVENHGSATLVLPEYVGPEAPLPHEPASLPLAALGAPVEGARAGRPN
ncbi:MAG TPA: hypothetical protein VF746_03455 [Longimicrobium sp.]|jgi:hypothetical protein